MVEEQRVLERIISLMDERKMSQKEICAALGLKSQQAFTNWKNGNNTSFMKHLPQIAAILETSVDYLLGNTSPLDQALEGIDFALSGEIKEMSDNEKRDVLDYILFKKRQKEDREG